MADFYGDFSGTGQYRIWLETWLISQNVANNTSTIGWRVNVQKLSGSGYYTGDSGGSWSVGGDLSGSGGWLPYDFTAYWTLTIGSGSTVVAHNTDGTKTASVSASVYDPENFGSASASGSMALPAIPRATQPAVSPNPVNAGSAATIDLSSRASSSFTHDITYAFGALTNQTAGLSASTGVGTSATFTPPLALLNQIPNAASGVCTITVVTKDASSNVIGTRTVNLTVQAGAAVRPTISSLSISEATTSPNVASIVGAYVQNVSKLNVTINGAAGAYSSTIVSYKITVGAQTINASSGTTPNPISGSGTVTVNAEVTDSRGRVSNFTGVPITVLAYAVPQITAVQVRRSTIGGTIDNTDGTYIRIDLTTAVQSLINTTQRNNLYYKVFTSPSGANTWTQRGSEVNVGGLSYNSNFVVTAGAPYSVTSSFDVRVEVRDNLSIATTVERTIATGAVLLDLNAADGVGIGKYHEDGMLDVAGDIYQGGYKVVDLSRIATLTQQGIVELATSAETIAGTDTDRAVTPAGLVTLTATDARRGLVELATAAEARAGTDTTRAITPATLRAVTIPVQGVIPASIAYTGGSAPTVADDGTINFTAKSAVRLNGIFDGTGADLYKIYIYFKSSTGAGLNCRLRNAGTDLSSSSYSYVSYSANLGSGPSRSATSSATAYYHWIPTLAGAMEGSGEGWISGPNKSGVMTLGGMKSSFVGGGDRWVWDEASQMTATSTYDGMSFILGAWTFEGWIKIVKVG